MTTDNYKNLQMAIAHSPNFRGENHYLKQHLQAVGELAADFLKGLELDKLGYYTGLWHDLGKYDPKWQTALKKAIETEKNTGKRLRSLGVPHAIHGAKLALKYSPLAALCIAGHHSGLPNLTDFKGKIALDLPDFNEVKTAATKDFSDNLITDEKLDPNFNNLQRDLTARILFSALIDADRLDTAAHAEGITYQPLEYPQMAELREKFNSQRLSQIANSKATSAVNQVREEIYHYCVQAGELQRGVFKLCAPTGGGKTFALQGFALNHAVKHHQRRIIYAAPFTTIIEQTADIYRTMFGANVVLEHHSAVKEDYDKTDDMNPARLAAQNWDAPIIVTTTVQLLESLFSNHPGKCRKVHNIVGSVIVIDEVQTLPTNLLTPILSMLQNLVDYAGCSVLLCTATQPAYELIASSNCQPLNIIPPEVIKEHFTQLKRVEYIQKPDLTTWSDIIADIQKRNLQQVLVIANTTKDARLGFAELKQIYGDNCYHLSTRMYPLHRLRILEAVKLALTEQKPCYLISTQLIEAGVDLDFSDAYRVIAPLDSIIQSAGRVNRNGKLDRLGTMTIFKLAGGGYPLQDYKECAGITQKLIDAGNDLNYPDTLQRYFQEKLAYKNKDIKRIQYLREKMQFLDVADNFKLIDEETEAVFIKVEPEAEKLLTQLEAKGFMSKADFKETQNYLVKLRASTLKQHQSDWFESLSGLRVWSGAYNLDYGVE